MGERNATLKSFDEKKGGVKDLLDSGLCKVPEFFIRPVSEDHELTSKNRHQVPVIDLRGSRKQIVEEVKNAAETWGFFQVVNHGIPQSVLDAMVDGIKDFNEQDLEEKKKYFSRDNKKTVRYNCSYDLFTSQIASWRDTLSISFPNQVNSHELPPICRESTVEYAKHIRGLGHTMLEILSEGLGLKPSHLIDMQCLTGHILTCHYYPACPEPKLTMGIDKHSDIGFLTILLQNQISGLQVLYQDQWVDILPIPGGLLLNIGDLLQVVSNGRYRSNQHRVVANSIGPRVSVANFISGPVTLDKYYGPVEELISEENPAQYKKVHIGEYHRQFYRDGLAHYRGLDYYKL